MNSSHEIANRSRPGVVRLRMAIRGAVQGVGFRPFVFHLATELGLCGWVNNSPQGVFLEAEGPRASLEQLLRRLADEKPPRSFIQSLEASWLDAVGYSGFEIRPSDETGAKTALVLPDIATCPECLKEILDPANRRYFYPFTNCTHCGPRFSIIEALPYDRAHTSMKAFRMCPRCQAEYDSPRDRRFHAQPNACPDCGPQLELWDRAGRLVLFEKIDPAALPAHARPLLAAAAALRAGRILAVKGLGGFHLMVDARNDEAVERLRRLKHREEKPFALMSPSLEAVRAVCEVSPAEERLLGSPEAPIVLLKRLAQIPASLCALLAPGNPALGVMLPYTPLHHLLLGLLGFPLVATSGNLSDEPICIDEHEALQRLGGIADLFLVHNRPVLRHVDDSIVRLMAGRELVLRRARGYAPLPVLHRAADSAVPILAVGAHLKNSVALAAGSQIFLSQHIGDLETAPAYEAFRRVIRDFKALYAVEPAVIAADAHPDYLSTQFAREQTSSSQGKPPRFIPVQHHLAHVLSCMAENELEPPLLGVAWDGTGYGLDGTVWGGEFFLIEQTGWKRVARLRPFRLPGGDAAVHEPRRSALGLLFEQFGESAFEKTGLAPLRAFTPKELTSLKTMLRRGLNSPQTSSIGRLFDAVSALVGLRQTTRFEGQAAMELEFTLADIDTSEHYNLVLQETPPGSSASDSRRGEAFGVARVELRTSDFSAPLSLDWSPAIASLLADVGAGTPVSVMSARFHNALAEAVIAVARRMGQERVALSGGCFQNRYLTERIIRRLGEEGFRPYWHQRVPPNDGGICLGQVIAARWQTV